MTKELKTKLTEGYSTTIVSIGEHSLLGRCASKADGLRSRVLEIDQPMTSSAEQADRIKSVCRKNNGHAAPMLAEYIINNGGIKNVLNIYNECRKQLLEIWPDTPSKERFVSKFPALLLTTAILAEAALDISFSQQELIDFFLQYESDRGELRNSAAASYPFIVEHCHTYINKFILKIDKTSPQYSLTASKIEMPKAECWGKITRQQIQHEDGRWIIEEIVVRKDTLEKILKENGYENIDTCIVEWKKLGVLDYEDDHHPRRYRVIDGSKERKIRMNIEKTLQARFAAPLQDNYDRRIIFWHDPEGEFSTLVDELCPEGVKLLKLTGTNNFAAKLLLSETDTESNYLVYNPISYSDIRDNWLLDIELYSEEFRADLLSIRMQELKMPVTTPLRKAMKSYGKFFENKERVAKLKALNSDYAAPGQLHIDILTVLAGAAANTVPMIIRTLLLSGLEIEENAAIANIRKFGNEAVLWELVHRYTGYVFDSGTYLNPSADRFL